MTEKHIELLNNIERDRWNKFVKNSPWGHLMQSWEWGEFKETLGWKVERVGIEQNGKLIAGAQILLRYLPSVPFSIAYVPKGPIVNLQDGEIVNKLLPAIHQAICSYKPIFLRLEPNLLYDEQSRLTLERYGFQNSPFTNQPQSTIAIDVYAGEDALLAGMRKKTRKLVRRAMRMGVEVVEGNGSDIDVFYQIISKTSDIKGFSIHSKLFYENAWRIFDTIDAVKLLFAKYQDRVVAAKMLCVFGNKSMHLWGGTSHEARNVYASYLLQWEAIKWARARGCKYCDLWGIPDNVGKLIREGKDIPKDRSNGLWGVYTFKRGFGGEIEYYVGAYDYPYRLWLYLLGTKLLMPFVSVDTMSAKWLEGISNFILHQRKQ